MTSGSVEFLNLIFLSYLNLFLIHCETYCTLSGSLYDSWQVEQLDVGAFVLKSKN